MTVAWWWLIVSFMAGVVAGIFMIALVRANEYDELEDVEEFKEELKEKGDGLVSVIFSHEGGEIKVSASGVKVSSDGGRTWTEAKSAEDLEQIRQTNKEDGYE